MVILMDIAATLMDDAKMMETVRVVKLVSTGSVWIRARRFLHVLKMPSVRSRTLYHSVPWCALASQDSLAKETAIVIWRLTKSRMSVLKTPTVGIMRLVATENAWILARRGTPVTTWPRVTLKTTRSSVRVHQAMKKTTLATARRSGRASANTTLSVEMTKRAFSSNAKTRVCWTNRAASRPSAPSPHTEPFANVLQDGADNHSSNVSNTNVHRTVIVHERRPASTMNALILA